MQKKINKTFCIIFLISFSVSFSQVFKSTKGTVEIIGLHSVGTDKIIEIIKEDSKTKSFHACAAVIKKEFGIPEVSVTHFQLKPNSFDELYTVIKFVDPKYSNRIHFINQFKDTLKDYPNWNSISELDAKCRGKLYLVLQEIGYVNLNNIDSLSDKHFDFVDKETFLSFFKELSKFTSKSDKEKAIWTIENDGNYKNRCNAVIVLSNFLDDITAYNHILKAIRHSDRRANSPAISIINSIGFLQNRIVDWSSCVAELRYILDGTNLFAFNTLLSTLSKTKISPSLATKLLKDGGDLIIDNLKAEQQYIKENAHDFLVQISGNDFGYDATKWQSWIDSL